MVEGLGHVPGGVGRADGTAATDSEGGWMETGGVGIPDEREGWFRTLEATVPEALSSPEIERLASVAQLWLRAGLFFVQDPSPFPDPLVECAIDASVSLGQAIHGWYKQAFATLREQLELAMLGCLFELGTEPRDRADKRELSAHHLRLRLFAQPSFTECADFLRAEGHQDLAQHFDGKEVAEFMRLLSQSVHGHPAVWNFVTWDFNPVPHHSAEWFGIFSDMFEATQHMALFWVLVANPKVFGWVRDQFPGTDWTIVLHEVEIGWLEARQPEVG